MGSRLITRAQSAIRGFFGLGPEQFSFSDELRPTFDLDQLWRGPQDCQIISGSSAAIAPGAAGTVTLSIPRVGVWQVIAATLASSGPLTSGNFRMAGHFNLNSALWANGSSFAFAEPTPQIPRFGGVVVTQGRFFTVPPLLCRDNNGNADDFSGVLLNESGSVGNATLFAALLVRQTEAVVRF